MSLMSRATPRASCLSVAVAAALSLVLSAHAAEPVVLPDGARATELDTVPGMADLELWRGLPRVAHWRTALAARASVQQAVGADYAEGLRRFLRARGSALSRRMGAVAA